MSKLYDHEANVRLEGRVCLTVMALNAVVAAWQRKHAGRRDRAIRKACAPHTSEHANVCTYTEVEIGERLASIWAPGTGSGHLRSYKFKFSWGKLWRFIFGFPLGGNPTTSEIPAGINVQIASEDPTSVTPRAVVLVHGLLCTRLDFAHIAETLAARGFTVVAPEMGDSVSYEGGAVSGGFFGALLARREGEAQRLETTRQAVAWLRKRGAQAVGLVGHSRGGVTVSQMEGRFCRVSMAGFLPPTVEATEGFHPSAAEAPMYVVCGQDDEVCTRLKCGIPRASGISR